MPYKDPVKRRDYQRELMRQRRMRGRYGPGQPRKIEPAVSVSVLPGQLDFDGQVQGPSCQVVGCRFASRCFFQDNPLQCPVYRAYLHRLQRELEGRD